MVCARIRRMRRSVLLAVALGGTACASHGRSPATDLESLSLTAGVSWDSRGRLSGRLTAHNPTSTDFTGTYAGVCAVTAVFWQEDAQVLRWDQLTSFNSRPGGCKSMLWPLHVPPDSAVDIPLHPMLRREILGDSLPAGEYNVGIRIYFAEPIDSLLIIPAGRVLLQP